MKTYILSFLVSIAIWTPSRGQDGSDILYGNVSQLDESYVGDFVHLDFYSRSFRGAVIDTIAIVVGDNPIKFIEHRRDNGFNNWFHEQYLESLESMDGLTIRIEKFRLEKITIDSVFVMVFLEYYKQGKVLSERSRQRITQFPKIIIAEVLVSAESHRRQKSR